MKRPQQSFSVEIKKSRTQGQRPHLPPRRLFAVPLDETSAVIQTAEPQTATEPVTAPRILPSIVEPTWSRSVSAEPARRKGSSGETAREQMKFDLSAASEDVNDEPAEPPVRAEADLLSATAVEKVPTLTHDTQPASEKSATSQPRKVRKKTSAVVEPAQAPEPAPDVEPAPYAEMIEPSMEVPSRSSERRLTKRLAAAGQLPRSERWKRRLHPATW
ncbi:hypothetical protein [Microvirga sp. VF16]|uniref:hypothetical protein n=1 Tax=Microvirga sp. VF16 TaxID=2807101 RepID=UPI00193E7DB9|nr:hypothetical protein [Microvirga sp. VF16]QRM35463.1 hypothetical protein JO965_44815 [Microvirga sp. VF16]